MDHARRKITLEELERRIRAGEIGEQEIRRYFRANEDLSSKPFFPGIEPDPETVELPPAGVPSTFRVSFGIGDLLIKEQRGARDLEFRNLIKSGYKGPVIVSRGDSWSLHPLLYDTVDWLRGAYAIHSFDWPGDTLDDILADRSGWEAAIRDDGAHIFLISGGGNDVIGGGAIAQHLNPYDPKITDPADYLRPSYHALVEACLAKLQDVFEALLRLSPGVSAICHGYDHVVPNGGKWIGQPMSSIGITDPELQKSISDLMVDGYNQKLGSLAKHYAPRVYHLDLRGCVTAGWDDELHPSNTGFSQVAAHVRGAIDLLARNAPALPGR